MHTDSDLTFCNSYEDGTSTNREPRQAYKTTEVGHSQLWARPWVILAYELLNRTRNGFHIKISVLLNKSKPALAQTQVSKWNILATSKLSYISVVHLLGEPTTDLACWMLTCHPGRSLVVLVSYVWRVQNAVTLLCCLRMSHSGVNFTPHGWIQS